VTRDLWEALHGDEVDEPELTTLLDNHFAGGRMEPGSDTVELTKEPGSRGEAALRLRFMDGILVDVDPGPALTVEDLAQLRALVEDALLRPQGEQVARRIFFSRPEVTGWWRYRDHLQLLPAPPDAPRAGFLMAMHPLVVEFAYPGTGHSLVRLVRQRFRTWELGLLLNLMLYAQVHVHGDRHSHHWVIDPDPEFQAKYLNEGYHLPGFVVEADSFSSVEGLARMPERPDDTYYTRPGIGSGDVADVPASLSDLLDRYFAMTAPERMRVLRAAYWLRHASDVWDLSHTAYHIAVVNAIEVMLAPGETDPCPTCGMNRAPGPTARFTAFLDTYAPKSDDSEPSRKELYRTRSKASHGHALLLSDVPRTWGGLEPAEWEELDQLRMARQLAQVAIVNWLREQG